MIYNIVEDGTAFWKFFLSNFDRSVSKDRASLSGCVL